ncbi:NUDIX hydrolase [Rhodotorula paludigena]|uniref:NUDIX hydrolase n=1 Tax=Rhodotorula paludigena TaxID=86838 RepID=UPI00317EDD76
MRHHSGFARGAGNNSNPAPLADPAAHYGFFGWHHGCSLLLLAPLSQKTADGYDYRCLLVKRHSKSRTYDSAHVMPGGNIDPVDLDSSAWTSLFPPTTSSSPAASSRLSSGALQALKLCAIRETLEETGLLLVESAHKGDQAALSAQQRWERLGAAEQTRWREEVHNDGRRFLDLLRELGEGIRPALSSLTHWSNWVTPIPLARRFDTHFFISILPPAYSASTGLELTHESLTSSDGVEITSTDWLTPSEAITRALVYTRSQLDPPASPSPTSALSAEPIILHPPQFNLLAELAHNHRSFRSLLSPSQDQPLAVRTRKVLPFTPQIATVRDDAGRERRATLLPGDEKYKPPAELGVVGAKGAKNRTYVLQPKKGQLGLTPEGCVRRGVKTTLGAGWEDMSAGDAGQPSRLEKL